MHLLERPEEEVEKLSRAIIDAQEKDHQVRALLHLQRRRNCDDLLVVHQGPRVDLRHGKIVGLFAIEKIGRYRGRISRTWGSAFALSGSDARTSSAFAELTKRIAGRAPVRADHRPWRQRRSRNNRLLSCPAVQDSGPRLTRLARGLPAGMEIEYVDQVTLGQALNERTEVR